MPLVRRVLLAACALALLLSAYLAWVQPSLLSRAQGQRLAALKLELAAPHATHHPAPGTAVALLEVPRLGIEQVVVVGSSSAQLAGGPVLLPGSALPGQAGVARISGRRWTAGAPFARLPELRAGDVAVLTDRLGRFHYVVDAPGARGAHQGDLVLSTAASASGEPLLRRAHLAGEAALNHAPGPRAASKARQAQAQLGRWFAQPLALLAAALLAALLGLVAWATRRAYARQPSRLVWLISTPILVALGLGLLEALALQIPAFA